MVYKKLCCYGTCKSDSRYSDGKIWTVFLPKSTKTQRNKQIMRQRSVVSPHIFLHLHSKQPFGCITCKFVCTYAAFNLKRVPGALYNREFNTIEPCTFENLTILMRSPIYACITCLTEWAFP